MALRSVNSSTPADTKTRILDAAEALFIDGGYDAMSMRQVTSAADVNLAAVNYHFGGKEALIHAVLGRYLDPMNAERLRLLDALEAANGDTISCEHLLVAMFLPALRQAHVGGPVGQRFLRFIGRAYSDSSAEVRGFLSQRYVDTSARFFFAFARALPHLKREELGFRLNFAMGALSGVLAGGNTSRLLNEFTQGQAADEMAILARLTSLIVAALQAPLPDASKMAGFVAIVQAGVAAAIPNPDEPLVPKAPRPGTRKPVAS